LIHADVPVVPNLGVLIADSVYHPGDSFIVPEAGIEMLLLPIHAPWSKIGEVLDFLISVRAPRVLQIHDGLLNQRGIGLVEGHVDRVSQRYVSRFEHTWTAASPSICERSADLRSFAGDVSDAGGPSFSTPSSMTGAGGFVARHNGRASPG